MKSYEPTAGTTFQNAITKALDIAVRSHERVQMVFNGVTIVIDEKSELDLLDRDFSLAMEGCIDKHVGPFPETTHSKVELARFVDVRAENERREKTRQEELAEETQSKQDHVSAALATAPQIDVSDPVEWQRQVSINSDPYGAATIQYAERWARLMQAAIASGETLADVAGKLSHDADIDGLTGFMYGCAVDVLSTCWVHGEELRKWHNGKYNHTGEGVVNPAILTISKE